MKKLVNFAIAFAMVAVASVASANCNNQVGGRLGDKSTQTLTASSSVRTTQAGQAGTK